MKNLEKAGQPQRHSKCKSYAEVTLSIIFWCFRNCKWHFKIWAYCLQIESLRMNLRVRYSIMPPVPRGTRAKLFHFVFMAFTMYKLSPKHASGLYAGGAVRTVQSCFPGVAGVNSMSRFGWFH